MMDALGSPFRGSLGQGWNQSVTESSSSGFTSVTINQMLDELTDSRNKLSIQSFKHRKHVSGSGSSGISETQWVPVGFVIRGEPSQPVGAEGFSGVGEDSLGSGGPARRMLGEGQTGLHRGEAGALFLVTQRSPGEGSCRVGQRHGGVTSRVYSRSCQGGLEGAGESGEAVSRGQVARPAGRA